MRTATVLLAAALGAAPLAAGAQSAPPAPQPPLSVQSPTPMNTSLPAPAGSPEPAPAGSGSSGGSLVTPKPETTAAPSGSNGSGEVHRGAQDGTGKHLGQIKHMQSGSLGLRDLRYALTHPLQEAKQVRAMKTVSFDKLRVYRLPTNLKSLLKIGAIDRDTAILAELSPSFEVAQTNGSNSPIAYLQNVLANINVSNALNNLNLLNGANVNVGVSLQDVLNGNKISIGSVAGIFVNSLGIITTITK